MKKALLFSTALFVVMAAYAQTEKGKKIIGANLNISSSSNSGLENTNKTSGTSFDFTINPNFGYFIKNNCLIGANVHFNVANTTGSSEYSLIEAVDGSSQKSNSIGYGAGGFARYYKKVADNFFFIVSGGVFYRYTNGKVENSDYNPIMGTRISSYQTHSNNISVSVGPGLVYFVTPKLGIQTTLGSIYYSHSASKTENEFNMEGHGKGNNYGINFNISSFYLGVNYYF